MSSFQAMNDNEKSSSLDLNAILPLPKAPNFKASSFRNAQGLNIATYAFDPAEADGFAQKKLKGVILAEHGYGGHSQYTWFMASTPGQCRTQYEGGTVEALCKAGYAVRCVDHQSFGRSDGVEDTRCYFKNFDDLVQESLQYTTDIVQQEEKLKGLPIFLFGLSMGGATCLRLAEEAPDVYKGMLLFAPMISLEKVRKASIWKCIKNQTVEPLIGCMAFLFPKKPLAKSSPNAMFVSS
jgi:alpha-beta hydrolase superfamily lysophospholipase